MSGCGAIKPTVHSNFDQSVNFDQYKTFAFFKKLDTDTRYESLFSQYLKKATTDEMTKRGFVLSENKPDLLINFHKTNVKKQDIQQIPIVGYGGYYRYHGSLYYDDWPRYRTFVSDYQQVTLKIDVVDRQQNKVIWQGSAVGREDEDKLDNLQQPVQKVVADIFQRFPVAIDFGK